MATEHKNTVIVLGFIIVFLIIAIILVSYESRPNITYQFEDFNITGFKMKCLCKIGSIISPEAECVCSPILNILEMDT